MRRILPALVAAAALLATRAGAVGATSGTVVHYPSAAALTPGELQAAMSDPSVSTIVFEKGEQDFSGTLFVFKRNDLLIRGATGDPKDVILKSSAAEAFHLEQTRGTTFRGLTIRTTSQGGVGIRMEAAPDAATDGFADDTAIERCIFHSYVGTQASVRASNLSIADSSFVSEPYSFSDLSGGAGIVWEDGPGLFVTRTRFSTATGVNAIAAILVRGAQSALSTGDRAKHVLLTHDRVNGDFSTGFDLADVEDAVVRGDRITFPNSAAANQRGRVAFVVRRAAATQPTENYDVRGNFVRRAHYGAWFVAVGTGTASGNDFRGCGSPQVDGTGVDAFGDVGGAMRMNLQGPLCKTTLSHNDFRALRSPITAPAVVLFPADATCGGAGNPGNRVDRGRPLFGGAQQ